MKGHDHSKDQSEETTFFLKYDGSFDFNQILSFMEPRILTGLEIVRDNSYVRTFRISGAKGFLKVRDNPEISALELQIRSTGESSGMEIQKRVRKMFDLDRDFTRINQKFSSDGLLSGGMVNGHVPRLPVAFDPFEFMIRAVLGQQISVKAATTLAARLAQKAGVRTGRGFPRGLDYFFPLPRELVKLEIDGLGITQTRQATIKAVCEGLLRGQFELKAGQDLERFQRQFSALKGIGDWTVNYVAMRGLGLADAFPGSDLGIIKSLAKDGVRPSKRDIMELSEKWRPYRAYAALCLWNS
ncbi:DNA-3-methyladenine glycosylase family protein [Desulfospira joergensenii]|uniref:DNA-3-methyladenine glycosylase family protein n=1 Tax=Desulfospira joergensenii TaxID=53329 RepID=UPI0003B3D8D9|nr:AlkA N-terminal domain-containing protein [Desulfospira joergensenii]